MTSAGAAGLVATGCFGSTVALAGAGAASGALTGGAAAAGDDATGAAAFGKAASLVSTAVPSTTMWVPQCLQVMRTFFPRTFSSGTAYFAGQPVQVTFIAYVQRPQMWRLGSPKHQNYHGFFCLPTAESRPAQIPATRCQKTDRLGAGNVHRSPPACGGRHAPDQHS